MTDETDESHAADAKAAAAASEDQHTHAAGEAKQMQSTLEDVATVVKREVRTAARQQRLDLDVRGLIGLIAVVGLFGIVFMQLITKITVQIPPEVAGVVGSVVGFYFGSRSGTGDAAANGARRDK